MDAIQNGWFSEIQNELWPGQSFSLKVKNTVHRETSKYQDIQIIETDIMDAIQNGWFSEIQNELWPGQSFSLKVKNTVHRETSKYQDIQIIETDIMDAIQNGWFSEIQNELWPGQSFSLKVKNTVHRETSKYQDIQIIETETYGTCLILDGIIQCTSRDEFSYQEMISFLPLCSHPNPEKVLIVGGGDGGVAREVVKHPLVKEVYQVEIDERVVELSKQYLPTMAEGFKSPKMTLIIGDGVDYMKNHKKEFDVIITDSSDPVGPAVDLFNESYYGLMQAALRDGGIVCSQAGSFWLDCAHIKKVITGCKAHFPNVSFAVTSTPSYPCGHIGFVIGSLDKTRALDVPLKVFASKDIDHMNLKYYSSSTHTASFVLPRWVHKYLYEM